MRYVKRLQHYNKVSKNEEGVASEIFTRSLMSNEMELSNASGNGDQDSLLGEQQ